MSSILSQPASLPNPSSEQGFDELWALFSFRGRMDRRQYLMTWVAQAVIVVLFGGLVVVISPFDQGPAAVKALMGGIALVGFAVTAWISLATRVKRYHDLDYSGWTVLVALIPWVGWFFDLLVLHLKAGTPGANRFGG